MCFGSWGLNPIKGKMGNMTKINESIIKKEPINTLINPEARKTAAGKLAGLWSNHDSIASVDRLAEFKKEKKYLPIKVFRP